MLSVEFRMDPITHFLTGACLGRSGFNRKTAYATLAMMLAAEAPDIDMVGFLGGPVAGFMHHRGITHTLVGAPFMALAVTGVVWCVAAWGGRSRRPSRFRGGVVDPASDEAAAKADQSSTETAAKRRQPPIRWFWIWLLALIADLSHLLLDYTNSYGLRPFFPFDTHWYSWSIVPIFSPVMFAMLALGLLVPALLGLVEGEMRRRRPGALRGRGWAVAALMGVCLLYAVRGAAHARAIGLMEGSASTGGDSFTRVAAVPVMVDPFTWHALGATRSGYQTATVHTLSGAVGAGEALPRPLVTPAVEAAERSLLGRVYLDWSSWPLVTDLGATPPPSSTEPMPPGATSVRFSDLRFAPASLGLLAPGASAGPLSGYVVVGSDGGVIGQWMDGAEQR